MIITLEGLDNESNKADCLTTATEFFAEALLGKRMAKNLTIDLEVRSRKKTDVKGECINEDSTKRSRWFTIVLRNESISEMIKTLAHEMVHVKQHVRNELGKKHVVLHKDGLDIKTEWQGYIWEPKKGEDLYYDSPWEVEAYGREVGLAYRFSKYWNQIKGWEV